MFQTIRERIEITIPKLVLKNLWNTAPVYPINAASSNFRIMSIRDKSIGLNNERPTRILSRG
jgi:hypothetical protein